MVTFTFICLVCAGWAASRREIWAWVPCLAPGVVLAAALIAAPKERAYDNKGLVEALGWVGFTIGLVCVGIGLILRTRAPTTTKANTGASLLVLLLVGALGAWAVGGAYNRADEGSSAPASSSPSSPCDPDQRALSDRGPRVDRVIDGDTIAVENLRCEPVAIAMLGIDAPNLASARDAVQPCAVEAARNARRWVRDHPRVTRSIDGGTPERSDGTRYGQVYGRAGDPTLSEFQIRAGLARIDADAGTPDETTRRVYVQLEAAARSARRGIWGPGCGRP